MSQPVLSEVFTAEELARAAGVDVAAVHALIASGELRLIANTPYIASADAIRAGRRLRREPPATTAPARVLDATVSSAHAQRRGMPAALSSLVHAALIGVIVWSSAGTADTGAVEAPRSPERLVFIMTPGPGGGGGGGGLRNPLPAPRIERRGPERQRVAVPPATPRPVATSARREEATPRPLPPPVPQPAAETAPEPLATRVLVAPVVTTASDTADREGVVEDSRAEAPSAGAGTAGGSGRGHGTGSGQGVGSGLGDGSGGGTGGGPYRPGSGIEPPRLLREVKPEYTDDARRRGLVGEVLLEIVVQRDGTVGEIRLMRGLGGGLDERAIEAVRQWRFAPARRQGAPVDVLVEVAVEFTLR